QWAVMGEGNVKFSLNENTKQITYSPTTYHQMGAHKNGNDISFKFWAPDAKNVNIKVFDQNGRAKLVPMTKDSEGNWSTSVRNGWKTMEGKAYNYQVTDSGGKIVERTDPYARQMQGEQMGVGRTYVSNKGERVNQFHMDTEVYQRFKSQIEGSDPEVSNTARQKAYAASRSELVSFEIDDQPNIETAYLVLKDANGHQLTKNELVARLGQFDSTLIDKMNGGKANNLWLNNIDANGRIKMTNQAGSWSTVVNNLDKMVGLRYEFQAYERKPNGQLGLVGDTNNNGRLTTAELRATAFNDKWGNTISKESGRSFRGAVIADTSHDWKNDNAPREKDHNKWVVYQFHTGSFFGQGDNANRSTFEDVMNKLDYFKSLGVNTLEMLPANEVEGNRDWGYMGANSLAVESSYGFTDDNGKYVSGTEALKLLIDMAHSKGFNIVNDVVYNHVGGDYNTLWNIDGKENPYFNWSKDPTKFEKRDTPWGAMPAYNNPKVKQLFVDHAVAQLEEFHFDGLRFDFTEPMKAAGGEAGWNMMREMNRQLHFLKPDTFIAAEQFDYDPSITRPAKADGTGGGFDAQWYTEFQHRLVRDNSNPGIIQQAANNQHTDMDKFIGMLTSPRGLDSWANAVTVISNHDEVGNAERTIDTADGGGNGQMPSQWARNAARFAAGIGLASPGVPMFFQGDETMAANSFKWGVPSTWDAGWDWQSVGKNWDWSKLNFNDNQRQVYTKLFDISPEARAEDSNFVNLSAADRQVFNDLAAMKPEERTSTMNNVSRRQMFEFYKDAIALRSSSSAFEADSQVNSVYTHNDSSVMAFSRKDGNEEYIVVASLNHNNLEGYQMPLPPGQWKEVLNSDAARYGGSNFGNFGATLNGGNTKVNIPAAGYIVLKKAS
ncbi:MAG: 1 4-alpha-glucan branching enzyme, partial [bacterium]